MDRRAFLKGMGAVTASATIAGCAEPSGSAENGTPEDLTGGNGGTGGTGGGDVGTGDEGGGS